MQAPPSIAAEVRKLPTVSRRSIGTEPSEISTACRMSAASPLKAAKPRIAGLIFVRILPTVAQ